MLEIEELHKLFIAHPTISTDTRKIEPGCMFFALKGDQFDGNKFSMDAINAGAAYAVIDDKSVKRDDRQILVDDVLQTLQKLAEYHRLTFTFPFIGITGSNGKTTTKELLNAVLSKKYNVLATAGNFNNHIGVPLTLLSLKAEHNLAIIEMGANHIGEIAFLSGISHPDIGIITNIGKAHLKGFGSYEGVIKAKTELYDYIRKNNGKLVINADDQVLVNASKGIESITYGSKKGDLTFLNLLNERGELAVEFDYDGKKYRINSNLFGEFNLYNIAVAVRLGLYFEVKIDEIISAIESYRPKNNRSQIIETASNKVILDAYNANPTSMIQALSSFDKIAHGKKMVVLGDMLELGDEATFEHETICNKISSMKLSNYFLVGEEFSRVSGNAENVFKDVKALNQYFSTNPPKDALILVKGSRGIQLEKCLDFIP